MGEDSRRPRSSPRQLSEGQVCEMVKLKLAHRHWGLRKIRTLPNWNPRGLKAILVGSLELGGGNSRLTHPAAAGPLSGRRAAPKCVPVPGLQSTGLGRLDKSGGQFVARYSVRR
jgi:hypothetical protein